jgi:hypothetical protein
MHSRYSLPQVRQRLLNRWDDILLNYHGGCNPSSRWYQRIEAGIPRYQLPDLLVSRNGSPISDAEQWTTCRRQEILELYRTSVYGRSPAARFPVQARVVRRVEGALDGIATIKEVRVGLSPDASGPAMTLLLFLPTQKDSRWKRTPIFLGLNFFGNHTVHSSPHIQPTTSWIPDNRLTHGLSTEQMRGLQSTSWPVEFIVRHGYGLATAYCGEITPDRPDGLSLGIQQWFQTNHAFPQTADSWGAIAGWAWGLSRAMDYLVQDEEVAADQVAVMGHSRLGKAALWAGAEDERFAMVVSNNSGCAGAALFRRKLRETISILNQVNPHWFCENFKHYNDRENELPVDQHMLLSLAAPRPLYVASAQLDLGADPMGEFLAAKHASLAYSLVGTPGLPTTELPPVDAAVMGQIGYHMRKGHHAVTLSDWKKFIGFGDKHFRRATPSKGV